MHSTTFHSFTFFNLWTSSASQTQWACVLWEQFLQMFYFVIFLNIAVVLFMVLRRTCSLYFIVLLFSFKFINSVLLDLTSLSHWIGTLLALLLPLYFFWFFLNFASDMFMVWKYLILFKVLTLSFYGISYTLSCLLVKTPKTFKDIIHLLLSAAAKPRLLLKTLFGTNFANSVVQNHHDH